MHTTKRPADRRRGVAVAGSLIGSILVSSCCIVPLLLVTLGVTGAWLGMLTSLAPYQEYLIVATLLFLGAGFWLTYRKKPARDCHDESFCGSSASDRIIRITLWTATVLAVLALLVNFLLPYFT